MTTQPQPTERGDQKQPKLSFGRRVLRWARRLLILAVFLVVVLLGAGYGYEQFALMRLVRDFPPPGDLVDIGGRNIHLHVQGQGSPTVVFESGLGAFSLGWQRVAPRLARFTRVVTYDRAGLGWSDPAPEPRDSRAIADDLHAALTASDVTGPFVLVGHSAGGLHVRMFSFLYPDEVVGIVLVDSSHEEQMEKLPSAVGDQLKHSRGMLSLAGHAARFGLPRLFLHYRGNDALGGAVGRLPQEIRPVWIELVSRRSHMLTVGRELTALRASMRQTAAAAVDWGDLPVEVLSAGRISGRSPDDFPVDETMAAWNEMQAELASRSTQATHRVIADSGHNIQNERPDVVLAAIRRIIAEVRRASDSSTT